MKKYIIPIFFLIIPFLFTACGEGVVELSEAKYETKIVIDAYIFAGKPVSNIRITRNFPLNENIDVTKIILFNADVKIIDVNENKTYQLTFDPATFAFKYAGNDLIVQHGKTYRLEVKATVDGKELNASSVTTVPLAGLNALQEDLGALRYRETDASGNVKKFSYRFHPSAGAEFYVMSIVALDAEVNSFIYDNAFNDTDSNDVKEDFGNFKYRYDWMQGLNSNTPELSADIEWYNIWFYGKYEVVLYAGDRNFHHFLVTHQNVQEPDGNFHEPAMYIDGDGIGVFGSAVADTLKFEILR